MPLENDAEHIAICDAVVDELNRGQFSQSFTAKRYYDPGQALKDVDALRVGIIPGGRRTKRITRGGARRLDYDVAVAVIEKYNPQDGNDSPDAGMLLAEEITDYLERYPLQAYKTAKQDETDIPATFSPEHLRDLHLFLAPATLTYRRFT